MSASWPSLSVVFFYLYVRVEAPMNVFPFGTIIWVTGLCESNIFSTIPKFYFFTRISQAYFLLYLFMPQQTQ